MKQLTCEMCGSVNLLKQDGVFVCQHCKTQYTVEEAKKMMIEGTVEVQGTVKVDNSSSIQNYIELSTSALDAGNGEDAFAYANKALELDPKNSESWMAKMLSIEHIGTLGDLKLLEVVEAGKNAIVFEKSDSKEETEALVYTYYLSRSLELLKLATEKMLDTNDVKKAFKAFCVLNVITAPQNCNEADRPNILLYDKIADEAIALTKHVPDECLIKTPYMAELLQQCAKQYMLETEALIARFKIYSSKLNRDASDLRNKRVQEMNSRAVLALKQAGRTPVEDISLQNGSGQKSGGCYVATCVYGSYDCPEVWTLRRFRDNTLGSTWYGRAFIHTYYAISPTLVKWFGETNWFKKMWRGSLDRMVHNLQDHGVADTPYEDKHW